MKGAVAMTPMPRKVRTTSPLELAASTPITVRRDIVPLMPQIALDFRFTTNRQDAFSIRWDEGSQLYVVRASGILPTEQQQAFKFHALPTDYSIRLREDPRKLSFMWDQPRLALTAEFLIDPADPDEPQIMGEPQLYRSMFQVLNFRKEDGPDQPQSPERWRGNPRLKRKYAQDLIDLTRKSSLREAQAAIMSGFDRILGQYLSKNGIYACYTHPDGTLHEQPSRTAMAMGTGAVHYDTCALNVRQVAMALEGRHDVYGERVVSDFLHCARNKVENPEYVPPRHHRREVHNRRYLGRGWR